MAIKVNGTTVIDDSRNLVNIASGAGSSTTYGAVGTYVLASNYGSGTFTPGNDKSASSINLSPSDTNGRTNNVNLSGTWRQMGHSQAGTTYSRADWTTTVWLRIA